MRTFIAIDLPKDIKETLADLEEQLKTCAADVKWVAPKNIHLTLKFLGEIEEDKLEKINQILEEVAKTNTTFSLGIFSLGAFPKINFPRIIWVGVNQGKNQVEELAKELEDKIAKIGIAKEKRPFSSHITLGRIRSGLNREKLVQSLIQHSGLEGKNLQFLVTKICLFKSTLTSGGPVYEAVKEINLKTS